jgi:hypothetical protein
MSAIRKTQRSFVVGIGLQDYRRDPANDQVPVWLDVQNVLGAISWIDVELGVVLDGNTDQIHDQFCLGFCSFFVSFAFALPVSMGIQASVCF